MEHITESWRLAPRMILLPSAHHSRVPDGWMMPEKKRYTHECSRRQRIMLRRLRHVPSGQEAASIPPRTENTDIHGANDTLRPGRGAGQPLGPLVGQQRPRRLSRYDVDTPELETAQHRNCSCTRPPDAPCRMLSRPRAAQQTRSTTLPTASRSRSSQRSVDSREIATRRRRARAIPRARRRARHTATGRTAMPAT